MSRAGIYKRARGRIPDCQESCHKGLFDSLGGKLVVRDRQNLGWKQGGKTDCCLGVPAHPLEERVKQGMQYCSDDGRRWPMTTSVGNHARPLSAGESHVIVQVPTGAIEGFTPCRNVQTRTLGSGGGSKHFWIAAIRSTSASM